MGKEKIYYWWYKVSKNLEVSSQSEVGENFDHSPSQDYILWIQKSGPHGYFTTPDIYDDPIYHYKLFDQDKNSIDSFHIKNGWYLDGISTIEEFRESYYQQLHIKDPKGIVKKRKVWSFVSLTLTENLRFIRDKLASFADWEDYEKHTPKN